jgi:hypothetical protein
LEDVHDRLVFGEDDEVAHFQHVAEMIHGLVDIHQLSIIGAVFLLGRAEFVAERARGCQAFLTRCCITAPM